MITLEFDDGNESDYTVALPILEERGLKGTSWIPTSWVGHKTRLNWDQVRELTNHPNWYCGCHTHTHPHLDTLSISEIEDEYLRVDSEFQKAGLDPPKHTAYPYGHFNNDVINVTKKYRLSGAGTSKNKFSGGWYGMRRLKMGKLRQGEVLRLYTHKVMDNPPKGNHITPDKLREIADYIVAEGWECVTAEELYIRTNS